MTASPTTIASSTTMPSTSKNANSEIRLMLTSRAGITIAAPRNATGIPIATHSASRNCKNNASSTSTINPPCIALVTSKSMRPRRITDSSRHVVIFTPCGSSALPSPATNSRTRCVIASASCSPMRNTLSKAVGSPSKRAARSSSAKASCTFAICPIVTRVPSDLVSSTRSSKSAPRYAWPSTRSSVWPESDLIAPAGKSSDDLRTASATMSNVRPWRRSADSETSIAIS